MVRKILILVLLALVILWLGQLIFQVVYNFPQKITYGVTFSPRYARYLGLDWRQTFISSLDQLNIKNLRIPTYWNELEKKEGEFSFDDTDFMVSEAGKRGANIILVVGFRQPRWPECYPPSWVKDLSLEERRSRLLNFISSVVERYKQNDPVVAFQVENEPFLPFFGEDCDVNDPDFLKKEVDLVRSKTNKTIIISDSGELGAWALPMSLSDIFGTTLYREVYNPLMGYFSYPIYPYLYNLKSQIIKGLFAPNNQKTIIIELQAEPWIGTSDLDKNPKEQTKHLPLKKMKEYIKYAKETGFDEGYLWGVEWWYFMDKMGYPEYLEYAKSLF